MVQGWTHDENGVGVHVFPESVGGDEEENILCLIIIEGDESRLEIIRFFTGTATMSNTKNAISPGVMVNRREFIVMSTDPRSQSIITHPSTRSGCPGFHSVPSVVPTI